MMDAVLSGCCLALATMVGLRARLPCSLHVRRSAQVLMAQPDVVLVLQMIAVALRQGASLPRTLMVIGDSVGGDYGTALCEVSRALHRGALWRDAWFPLVWGPFGDELSVIGDVLEDSWNRGVSPLGRIDEAIGRIRRHRRASIERGVARFGVRLLVPMGLCFLPAFILVGVIPSIGSFAT